jgi:hypothetical protein
LSLNGTSDFLNRFISRHKNSGLLLLLFFALTLQSCAANFTEKNQIPGKVLAIKSLGFRETSNNVSLKEIDPYTVSVTRNLCKTELLSVEHQALTETRFGTQSFDCTDAYATYIAHNITALGVPLLYDSVTGFSLLRERCRKNPPVYRIVTTESNDIINNEAYDNNTTACKELPVAEVLLTAKTDDSVIYIATSADGIASLPSEKVAKLERAAANVLIKYSYESVELTTRHLAKKRENPFLASSAATNSSLDDNTAAQWGESAPPEIAGTETVPEKNFVAVIAPPAPPPLTPPTIDKNVAKSVPAVNTADNREKAPTQADREGAGGLIPSAVIAPLSSGAEPPKNMGAADIKAASVTEKIAIDKAPAVAKSVGGSVGIISPPGAIPPQASDPEPVRITVAAESKTAPPPEKVFVAATSVPVHSGTDIATTSSIPKIISAVESSPKASMALLAEIKNAASAAAPHKAHAHAMARSAVKREQLKAEILLQQMLIMSPELYRLCCPLSEKLFWNIGY